ncbi:MAG: MFS transporter [Trueperaceae bacterium]|nr:MFS transporter [Trueperaceae bacterium]
MTRPDRTTLLAFGGILVVLFLVSTNLTVVGTALPRIIAELDGFHLYAWAFTAFILTSTISLPVFGRLSDTYGRKRLLLFGIVLFSVASAAAGFAQTMGQLVVLRAVQGLGGGALMAMTWASLGDLFTPRQRGAYQGFTSGVFGLSSVIGPIIGGVITDTIGWRWVFFVNVPIAIVAFAVVQRYVPVGRRGADASIDVAGVVLLTLCTVPLLLALSWGGVSVAWASPLVLALLAGGALAGAAFVWWELRAQAPIIPFGIFRDRTVAISGLGTFLSGGTLFVAIIYLPLYVQGVAGGSAAASGFALAPLMGGFVVAGIVSGQGVSRSGHYKRWIVGAGVLTTLAFGLVATMDGATPVPVVVLASFLLGLGLGPPLSLYVLASQNATAPALLGTVTSAVQFFRQVGGMLAVAVFGSVIAARLALGLERANEVLAGATPETRALVTSPNTLTDPVRLAEASALLARDMGEAAVPVALLAVRGALGDALSVMFACTALLALAGLVAAVGLPSLRLGDGSEAPGRNGPSLR